VDSSTANPPPGGHGTHAERTTSASATLQAPAADSGPLKEATGKLGQVFISHTGAQKRDFVDFLEAEFNDRFPALTLFLDDYSLPRTADELEGIRGAVEDAFVGKGSIVPCAATPHAADPSCQRWLVPTA
jgi:hypothetical protein